MEGVGARLGRSSSRYGGQATVFTGPVRRWKKKWVHVTPSSKKDNNNNNNNSASASATAVNGNGNGDGSNGSHILFYKWAPMGSVNDDGKSESNDDELVDVTEDGPPKRRFKYVPVALLEEEKKEVTEIEEDDKVEEDDDDKVVEVEEEDEKVGEDVSVAVELSEKKAGVEGKPDMNDFPMEDNEEEEKIVRQDLNESTVDIGLNLNANDADSENNSKADEPQPVEE